MSRKRKDSMVDIKILPQFLPLLQPARYKVCYGGRGGGRSWSVARILLYKGIEKELLILCTRAYQVNIGNSVYRLLCDQIRDLGLEGHYRITKTSIIGENGTEFIFRGLQNPVEIKSLEGVDICWVEEAQNVEDDAWDYLIPTIRKEGSEIWITLNPDDAEGETYKRFILNKQDDEILIKSTYKENKFFPDVLRKQMEWDRTHDYEKYLWIWEGEPRRFGDALVFKGKFSVEEFETPENMEFYFGADFGFAEDPSTLVRCWIRDGYLYVDYEAYGVGVEIEQLPEMYKTVPGSDKWRIVADSSRPETIDYIKRKGYNIVGAHKGKNSVEEGVEFMRSFKKIILHTRCTNTINEFKSYRYKQNKLTGEPIPIIEDENNHCIDAIRYAIERVRKGGPRVWVL